MNGAATSRAPSTGLVLSGGGTRGAYEVGVVAAIVEILGLGPGDAAPFDVYTGASVGAINASYFAAHSHRGDLSVRALADLWRSMRMSTHLRFDVAELVRAKVPWLGRGRRRLGWSIIDPGPVEELVRGGIDFSQLARNVERDVVRALMIAALDISTGRTTMFSHLSPSSAYRPSKDPRRTSERCSVEAEHVLASSALPILFPARRIDGRYYCDGGLRFNTPIAPAIRAGAERLCIVSLLYEGDTTEAAPARDYPSLTFLLGKLLNALLADPITRDLQVLEQMNKLVAVLEDELDPDEMARIDRVTKEARGLPYRRLDTFIVRPSADIGLMANAYLRKRHRLGKVPRPLSLLLSSVERSQGAREADWASYLLFDGDFAGELIDLGRRDVLARAAEVRAFFA